MNHQPFDNWILNDEFELSQEESRELQSHLETCHDCHALFENWKAAETLLKQSSQASAPVGFTNRWAQSLAEKKLRHQKKQFLKTLFFLISGVLVVGTALSITLIETSDLVNLFVLLLKSITDILISLSKIERVLSPFLNDVPVIIPIGVWILFSMTLIGLVATWLAAVWKLAFRGEFQQ